MERDRAPADAIDAMYAIDVTDAIYAATAIGVTNAIAIRLFQAPSDVSNVILCLHLS